MTYHLDPKIGTSGAEDEWRCLSYDTKESRSIGPLIDPPTHLIPHSSEWDKDAENTRHPSEAAHFDQEFTGAYDKYLECVTRHWVHGVVKGDCPRTLDQSVVVQN